MDDFDLPELAEAPLDMPAALPGMRNPQAPTAEKNGGLGQLAKMLPLIAAAASKGGRAGIAGFLQGVQRAQQMKMQQTRLGQQDARQQQLDQRAMSQQNWQRNYQQQQLAAAAQQRKQALLQQFGTALNGVDDPEAVRALLDLYGGQADAVGVGRPVLEKFAMQVATPTKLQERAAQKRLDKLKAEYGAKWMDEGAKFMHDLPGGERVSFQELLRRGGMTPDPQAPPPAPEVANTPEEQFYQRYAAENGARSFADLPTTKQQAARKAWMQADDRPPAGSSGSDGDMANAIADSIVRGEQPPETTGLYRYGAAVRAALAKRGYNLSTAQTDWRATQRHFSTLNGTQQTRMRQAVDNASHSLDVIEDLASQWKGGKFPTLNKGRLAAARSGALGPDAQRIATALEAQIADVTSELANVYMGGNSPTDHALDLASKNLAANWSEAQLKALIAQARTNLQIRQNSITNTGVVGASPSNPYGGNAPAAGGGAAPVPNPFRR